MSSNPSPEVDVRGLSVTREVTAYANGGLFPVLTATPSGKLIAAVRGGAGHLGTEGRIEIIRWLDRGVTWSPPAVVADSAWDDRNPALGVSSQGTLVLAYHRQGNYDAAGNYLHGEISDPDKVEVMVTRSHDDGLTWEAPAPLRIEPLTSASPYGKIVCLTDGTLLLALYGQGSWLVRSVDNGQSWGKPTRIAEQMTETALLVLTDGNRNPPYRIEGRISRDGGHTWLSELLTFSGPLYGDGFAESRPTDLGYPSNAQVDGIGVTLYYYNPSMHRSAGISRVESPALYSAAGYRTVAIVWDEAALLAALTGVG